MPRLNTRRFTNLDILGTIRPESPVNVAVDPDTAMQGALIESPNTPCRSLAAVERGSK